MENTVEKNEGFHTKSNEVVQRELMPNTIDPKTERISTEEVRGDQVTTSYGLGRKKRRQFEDHAVFYSGRGIAFQDIFKVLDLLFVPTGLGIAASIGITLFTGIDLTILASMGIGIQLASLAAMWALGKGIENCGITVLRIMRVLEWDDKKNNSDS